MDRENVENLEELLKQKIDNKKIIETKISRLTAPGDNYGGLLLKVDVTLEDTNGVQDLHVVSKSIPVNKFLQKLFDIQVSFKKEIAVYDTIMPLLREFQRECGIKHVMDILPRLYGARVNLNASDVVDENSAIAMENLVHSGYKNVERSVGFDLEISKMILKNLAVFHSTSLAFNMLKPDEFEKKIKPYLTLPRTPLPAMPFENGPRVIPHDLLKSFIETSEVHYLFPKLKDILKYDPMAQEAATEKPFFTITHGDLWGNNIMIKFENGKPVGLKLVDFQNVGFRSPVTDLLFFLWTGVQQSTLEQNLDDLIKLYHENFIENLTLLKCDTSLFSFEQLLEEIKIDSRAVLGRILFMSTFVIYGKKEGIPIHTDLSKTPNLELGDLTPLAKQRVIFVINQFNKKGWL